MFNLFGSPRLKRELAKVIEERDLAQGAVKFAASGRDEAMAELIEVGKILQDTEARADHLTVALNAIKGLKTKRPGKVAEAMAKVAEEALG